MFAKKQIVLYNGLVHNQLLASHPCCNHFTPSEILKKFLIERDSLFQTLVVGVVSVVDDVADVDDFASVGSMHRDSSHLDGFMLVVAHRIGRY